MIGQSDIRPQPFTINNLANGMSELVFYENVTEIHVQDLDQTNKTVYEFEMYEINIPQRSGLYEDVSENQELWLTYAKGQTSKPLSDKEKLADMQIKLEMQDAVLTEIILGGLSL